MNKIIQELNGERAKRKLPDFNPGDTIVIPEKPIRPTAIRELIDYSQIFSSFGIAAAAIEVIR